MTDSKGHHLYLREEAEGGKFMFNTDDYDVYEICFSSRVPPSKSNGFRFTDIGIRRSLEIIDMQRVSAVSVGSPSLSPHLRVGQRICGNKFLDTFFTIVHFFAAQRGIQQEITIKTKHGVEAKTYESVSYFNLLLGPTLFNLTEIHCNGKKAMLE